MLTKRDHARPNVQRLPYVPDAIAETDLVDGVFLYSVTDRKKLLSYLKKKYAGEDVRVSKEELSAKRLPARYSVIVFDDRYYLMYLGRQHNRHAGAGGFGVVKYLQDLETGEFDHVMKIFSEWHQAPGEMKPHHVDVTLLSGYFNQEYENLRELGEASASKPIWRYSSVKGMQFLKPQKTKKGMNLERFMNDYRALHRGKIRDPQYILIMLINMCRAVNDLHQKKNILHRDIKPQNFIVNPQTAEVELIDFGFAISADCKYDEKSARMGTLSCVAPEIVKKLIPEYSKKSDAFGLGAAIAAVLDIAADNTGGFLGDDPRKFIPRSLKRKNATIVNDSLLHAIYKICEKLLLPDPVDRMDIPRALGRFKDLLHACVDPVKLLAFNISDYIGLSDEEGIIEFLSRQQIRQIVIVVNNGDENNPEYIRATLGFTRLAQQLGYIVYADVLVVPAYSSQANILQTVADYLDQATPFIKYECLHERYIPREYQKYLDALSVVVDSIPNRSLKKKFTEKFADLRQSGASASQMVAALKLFASDEVKARPKASMLGVFAKNNTLTRQMMDVISHLDLDVAFSKSQLSVLAAQFNSNKPRVKY